MIVAIGSDLCNIGHYLVGEAIFVGLEASVTRMRELMDAAS